MTVGIGLAIVAVFLVIVYRAITPEPLTRESRGSHLFGLIIVSVLFLMVIISVAVFDAMNRGY